MGNHWAQIWSQIDVAFSRSFLWAPQAYDFIELFSGEGWLTRTLGAAGKSTAAFDILLGNPEPGKQDVMDLTTPSGFWFLVWEFQSPFLYFSIAYVWVGHDHVHEYNIIYPCTRTKSAKKHYFPFQ